MKPLWAVDFGGTKIEVAVADGDALTTPLCRMRAATEAHLGYEKIIANVVKLIRAAEMKIGSAPELVGFACCGTVEPNTGLMKNCNSTCLNGKPFQKDIEAALGVKTVFSNDANCFALAEAVLGSGKGSGSVFGVILGTGVGGGIVIDGKVVGGAQGIGGEWGHNVLVEDGPECYCGKRGCVERIIAGPALEEFYRSRSGESRLLPEIAQRAIDGVDAAAKETIERFVAMFAKGISVVVNILDPEVVVLGGGASNVEALYQHATESMKHWVFNNRVVNTKLVRHSLGDSAGVFGALLLAKQAALDARS